MMVLTCVRGFCCEMLWSACPNITLTQMNQSSQKHQLFQLLSTSLPQQQQNFKQISSIIQSNPQLLNQVENGENLMLPIHYACKFGNQSLVELFIKHDSLVDEKDARERTPLYYAISSKNFPLIQLLFENERVTKIVPDAFFLTAEMGLLDIMKYMMEHHEYYLKERRREYTKKHGKEPSSLDKVTARFPAPLHEFRDSIGTSILHVAATYGSESCVRYLIDEWNMDYEETSALGLTPIIYATMEGHDNVVRTLLFDYQANIFLTTNVGRTVLHYASDVGNVKMVNWFLERTLHPNDQDTISSWTALHFAAAKNHVQVMRRLLDEPGTDVRIRDKAKKLAVEYTKDDTIRAMLQERYSQTSSFLEKLDALHRLIFVKNARYVYIILIVVLILWFFKYR